MPKISVIMPIYNVEKYIRMSFDSILNQTFKDIEIICVNDGSTDNSSEILKEYAEKDNRFVIINQENMGAEAARSTGMKAVKSEFIHFFDPDDSADPTMYEKAYNAAIEFNVDFVTFAVKHVFEDGSIDPNYKDYFSTHYSGFVDISKDKPRMLVTLWNKLFRKSIIDKYDIKFPYTTEIRFGFDEVFNFMYQTVAKTVYSIQEPLYNYHLHPNSTMSNYKRYLTFDIWYGYHLLYEYIKEHSFGQEIFDRFLVYYSYTTSWFYEKYLDKEHKQKSLKLVCDFLTTIDSQYGTQSDIMNRYFSYLLKLKG